MKAWFMHGNKAISLLNFTLPSRGQSSSLDHSDKRQNNLFRKN